VTAALHVLDGELDQVRAEDVAAELRRRESDCYRLLRRVFIQQANGDFDLGTKLQEIMRDVEEPMTEAEFDACMARAVKAIGPIGGAP
jgi:hypothetical protein